MAQRNTFRDDEDLEEKINMRDLARVGVYLKPYMARVVWILIVVAAMGCINVVEPYLTKIMIDSVIPAKNLALLGELVALLAVLIVIYEFGLRYRTVSRCSRCSSRGCWDCSISSVARTRCYPISRAISTRSSTNRSPE